MSGPATKLPEELLMSILDFVRSTGTNVDVNNARRVSKQMARLTAERDKKGLATWRVLKGHRRRTDGVC